jgi:hypothetical protein
VGDHTVDGVGDDDGGELGQLDPLRQQLFQQVDDGEQVPRRDRGGGLGARRGVGRPAPAL